MKGGKSETWFDWVVVERMKHGEDPGRQLTNPEIFALLAWATAEGLCDLQLAERAGVSKESILRWKRKERERGLNAVPVRCATGTVPWLPILK